jgi:hypothetical protein
MRHSVFGWDYPPGCSGPPEPADDEWTDDAENEPTDEELAEWARELIDEEEVAIKNNLEKQYNDAFRLYQLADGEQAHLEGNAEYASNGFREAARRLLAVAASQRSEIKRLNREIGRLERESAPLVRPEGKCVTLESGGVEWKV